MRGPGRCWRRAGGEEGIASLCRSLHENAQFLAFDSVQSTAVAGGELVHWSGRLRNWGCGGPVSTSGWVRIEAAAGRARTIEFAVEGAVYRSIFRPGPWEAQVALFDAAANGYSVVGRC